jgi:predicted LPLAT superfamily acyltransferase
VVLFFGIHTGPRRYEVRFEAFADMIVAERATRTEDITRWLRRYVGRLDELGRAYPFNWFNYYDFWDVPSPTPPLLAAGVAAAAAVQGDSRSVATSVGGSD